MANIVIDLTPVLPGGENGGAKSVVLELVRQLGKLNPTDKFLLLTAEATHNELAFLESSTVRRFCILRAPTEKKQVSALFLGSRFLRRALNFLKRKWLPVERTQSLKTKKMFQKFKPDLVFSPFTAAFYVLPNVPIVSIVYDLQFLTYPYFFSPEVVCERNENFRNVCKKASRLICISAFTRQSVLKYVPIQKTAVIPIYTPSEWLQKDVSTKQTALLTQYNVERENFLLYPANFWKHKNHKILLTAFGLYRKKYPHSSLKLVCTGAPETGQEAIRLAAEQMGLSSFVVFSGYVSSTALFVLMSTCKALIFPSLYEGFGMPVVEAMLLKKPVLCSRQEALQEVAGETAFYFHPGKPQEICEMIEKMVSEYPVMHEMVLKGYKKALDYVNTENMARSYRKIFADVIVENKG